MIKNRQQLEKEEENYLISLENIKKQLDVVQENVLEIRSTFKKITQDILNASYEIQSKNKALKNMILQKEKIEKILKELEKEINPFINITRKIGIDIKIIQKNLKYLQENIVELLLHASIYKY